MSDMRLPDPLTIIVVATILSLAPFMAVMMTSYVKLSVVLTLIRNALGVQNVPPNLVLNGLALVLTIYIMAPVAQGTFAKLQGLDFQQLSVPTLQNALNEAKVPITEFLEQHTNKKQRRFFFDTTKRLWPETARQGLSDESFVILLPAFCVSELTVAFQIGFLLYLPFIAIDLIVSNILLAMGMMMVSPMTISLPFKLLLFVLVDGWTRLIQGLVVTYILPGHHP